MTLTGCIIGFGWPSCWSTCARRLGFGRLPLRVICVTYVEFFRRIPFLVIVYLVLFFIQALTPNASLSPSPSSPSASTRSPTPRHHPWGLESVPHTQVEAARTMNMSRLQTTIMVVLPQAWPVIIPPAHRLCRVLHQGHGAGQPDRRVRTDVPGQGVEQPGLLGRAGVRHHRPVLLRPVLPAYLWPTFWRETACHTSRSTQCAQNTGNIEVLRGIDLSIEKGEIAARWSARRDQANPPFCGRWSA